MGRFARLFLMVMVGAGCGGGGEAAEDDTQQTSGTEVVAEPEPAPEPEPPPPPAPGRARVIHAAAGAASAEVTGTAGDAALGAAAFKSATAYGEVVGGGEVSVSLADGTPVTAAGPAAGAPGTVVVYSDATTPANLAALALVDEQGTVMGQQRARLVNALLGAATLDLCLPGETARSPGTTIFMGVAYGDVGGIPAFPSRYQPVTFAGPEVRVQVRVGAENPCSGRVIGTATLPEIDINAPHNITIVAVGRMTGRPAVAKELLICQDAPGDGSCVSVPVR